MFAPWQSQNSLYKRKDPITGNSFIPSSLHSTMNQRLNALRQYLIWTLKTCQSTTILSLPNDYADLKHIVCELRMEISISMFNEMS